MSAPTLDLELGSIDVTGVKNARRSWTERTSARITLTWRGQRARAEATPLPDYSPDTLEQARADIQGADVERALDAPDDLAALEALEPLPSPSARFGLECALLELRARLRGRNFDQALGELVSALGGTPHDPPTTWVALLDAEQDLREQLARARQRGAAGFKVKIGREPAEELRFGRALCAALRPGERLRLDANGSLHSERELAAFAALSPEFVEEPLEVLGTPRALAVPLALDETLFRDPAAARSWLGHAHAVVLKPMVLGLLGALTWSVQAERAGARVVLSHCFDGALAARHYAALARLVGTPGVAMGLGPHPGLALWQEEAPP